MTLSKLSLYSVLGFTLIAETLVVSGQTVTSSTTMNYQNISSAELRARLRGSDGLTRLSQLHGDIELSQSTEQWGEYDLHSLVETSDLVIIGKIAGTTSFLVDNGDSIATKYSVKLAKTLKGAAADAIDIEAEGGTIKLPTSHRATIHTQVSDRLEVGGIYIMFLKYSGTEYRLLNSIAGVMKLNEENGEVHVVDAESGRNPGLLKEVEGRQRSAVEHLILNSIR